MFKINIKNFLFGNGRKIPLLSSLVGFVNGFFSSGGGIVAVLTLQKLIKLDEKKAHATAISVILPLSLASMIIFAEHGYAPLGIIIKTALGSVLGAIIGAKLLSGLPKKYIKTGFGIAMVIASVRMFAAGI